MPHNHKKLNIMKQPELKNILKKKGAIVEISFPTFTWSNSFESQDGMDIFHYGILFNPENSVEEIILECLNTCYTPIDPEKIIVNIEYEYVYELEEFYKILKHKMKSKNL